MVARDDNAPLVLILAGGSGTRFWPLSRKDKPKQFLPLTSERSLLAETGERARRLTPANRIYVVGLSEHRDALAEHLPWIRHWVLEPVGRNTAAAVALGVSAMIEDGHPGETPVVVLPADHAVPDSDAFVATLTTAVGAAKSTKGLVTLGIEPTSPHTGYGYIRAAAPARSGSKVLPVERFVEKPPLALAESLLREGGCYWNSGMFVWRLDVVRGAFERHAPGIWRALSPLPPEGRRAALYAQVEATPVDRAILERADNVLVVPTAMPWSDVGSWGALASLVEPSRSGNSAVAGTDARFVDSSGCFVRAPGMKVGVIGAKDLVVVKDGDRLLIVSRSADQRVRELADAWPDTRSDEKKDEA